MRNKDDRRQPHATSMFPFDDDPQERINRRHRGERRMENLSLEERQLQLSEMPSLKPKRSD